MQLVRNLVLLIFGSICFRPSYYYVYRQLLAFQENVSFVFSEPIEVTAGLLFDHVLARCNLTGSKCSRITYYIEVYTA